ncbi:MAG TPA: ankyrin repeat domain-containing protein [Victivallales bacterium]|nr:ankyrin repeat domain-containing protein [Victivallales bacterium]
MIKKLLKILIIITLLFLVNTFIHSNSKTNSTIFRACFFLDVGYWPSNVNVHGLNIGLATWISPEYEIVGADIAWFVSASNNVHGLQLSPLNQSQNSSGMQLGFANFEKEFTGFQLGIFNEVGESTGFQLGLINISERNSSEFQIGLINIMDNGFLPWFPFINFPIQSKNKTSNNQLTAKNRLEKQNIAFSHMKFFMAAEKGDLNTLKLFIEAGISPNVKDNGTALLYAVRAGKLDAVKYLINQGANVNEQTYWGTPLGIASYKGRYKIAEYLINHGAIINDDSRTGMSPLFSAAVTNKTKIVDLLLKNGADPNFEQPMTQDTPLIIATKKGELKNVSMLIKYGANINYQTVGGFTALDWALLDNKIKIVELLVNNGAYTKGIEKNIGRPMHYALERGNEEDNFQLAELLIKHGADINAKLYGDMPLIVWCAKRKLNRAVRFLIDRAADLSATSKSGMTALDYALQFKNTKLINILNPRNKLTN